MLIPYNTDAPLYHWPFATVGLIIANIVSFIVVSVLSGQPIIADLETINFLCLQYGVINPLQWFTSIFIHAGFFHLLGNMFFLWPFGLIVEGKVGWWRFLMIYLLIGAGECAVEQLIMLDSTGVSLGASAAISGLMAICLIWAPKNELSCWFVLFLFPWVAFQFEMPVGLMAGAFVLFDIANAFFTSFSVSTSVLHLMGAGLGAAVGVLLVVTRQVDCDGYDLISIAQGREGVKTPTMQQKAQMRTQQEELAQQRLQDKQHGLEMIQHYLDRGHIDMAIQRWNLLVKSSPGVRLNEQQLVAIAKHFLHKRDWNQAVVFLKQIIDFFPGKSAAFRVRLAQIYIVEMARPSKGLETLRPLVSAKLDDKTKSLARRLIAQAQRMISDGAIEVEGD